MRLLQWTFCEIQLILFPLFQLSSSVSVAKKTTSDMAPQHYLHTKLGPVPQPFTVTNLKHTTSSSLALNFLHSCKVPAFPQPSNLFLHFNENLKEIHGFRFSYSCFQGHFRNGKDEVRSSAIHMSLFNCLSVIAKCIALCLNIHYILYNLEVWKLDSSSKNAFRQELAVWTADHFRVCYIAQKLPLSPGCSPDITLINPYTIFLSQAINLGYFH